MDSSRQPDLLTSLQRDLLKGFFARENRLVLTGGAALAGFYLGHRVTDDLDLFSPPGLDLEEAARAAVAAALECGATIERLRTYPDFQRFLARRGDERCVIDLVIDRAPMVDSEKARFGNIRVDTLREIAANKFCTLISRSEIKDLMDLKELVRVGVDLEQAFEDGTRKDAGLEPGALAWVLDQLTIGPGARLPGDLQPQELLEFRDALVRRLRAMAFQRARLK